MKQQVKDNNSRLVGYIGTTNTGTVVTDANNRLLGTTSKDGTFDRNHRKISQTPVPGLLLKK